MTQVRKSEQKIKKKRPEEPEKKAEAVETQGKDKSSEVVPQKIGSKQKRDVQEDPKIQLLIQKFLLNWMIPRR